MDAVYKNHFEKIALIKKGKLSLVDNVHQFIKNIKSRPQLNAFNTIFEDEAVVRAMEIQTKIEKNTHGKLAGMVIAVKDLINIENKPLTCSSNILKKFTSLYNATAVKKLIDEDAIIIGQTNCDEFAMGSSNENSAFGPVRNPHNEDYVPGGSSGGSAAAVAAHLCDASLGTDTGGSIRQPAAFCGTFGLKPTYGRVSRYGLTAFASSFDTIGPFANSIEDIALITEVISGYDEKDSTSYPIEVENYSAFNSGKDKIKIGIPSEYFGEGLDEEIKSKIDSVIASIKKDPAFEIKEISLPHTEYSIATYYILTTAEASSNLSRFDGARYGYRSPDSDTLEEMYVNSRSEGFGREVKRRIMLGTYVLSAGYYDAYFKKAQQVRRILKNDFDKAFEEIDLILTPTTPSPAFKLGEKLDDPLSMYLADIYTTSANLTGIPGLNIPLGLNKNGLPMGMQLMVNQFQENLLLCEAKNIFENHI